MLCRSRPFAFVDASKGLLLGIVLFQIVVVAATTRESPRQHKQDHESHPHENRHEQGQFKEILRRHDSPPQQVDLQAQKRDGSQARRASENGLGGSSQARPRQLEFRSFATCPSAHHRNNSVEENAYRSTIVVGADNVWARLTQAAFQQGQCPSPPCCQVSKCHLLVLLVSYRMCM